MYGKHDFCAVVDDIELDVTGWLHDDNTYEVDTVQLKGIDITEWLIDEVFTAIEEEALRHGNN